MRKINSSKQTALSFINGLTIVRNSDIINI